MFSAKSISVFIASILIHSFVLAQDVLYLESFTTPEKGYWGGGSDMSGITTWTLDASACTLTDASDYIKTVTTSDGRMEAVDIDGEAIWTSELIDVTGYTNIALSVLVSETGSSTNVLKYVKVYYKLDGGAETLFETNGENIGNFGSLTASQSIASGTNVQIIVRINNPNAGDKTIFDEVTVSGDPPDIIPPKLISVSTADANNLVLKFDENLEQTTAETVANYLVNNTIGTPQTAVLDAVNNSIVKLNFANQFTESLEYSIDIANIDDLNGNTIKDTTASFTYVPFRIEKLFVLNKNELILEFSHNLDAVSVSSTSNYTVDNSIGNPATAVLQSETNRLQLNFTADFPENIALNLNIQNLEDENNIVIGNTDTAFYWHDVAAYDLLVNEIMADPVPSVALPEFEYLEIYNKTDYPICLQNWELTVGTTARIFPLMNIQANEYLIICSQTAQESLNIYGNTVGILGSSDLTNSGKELALKTANALTVDTLFYKISWYQDEDKDNGGWSLERIDYGNTCGQLNNWKAAMDISGGTPGKQNSVYAANIDTVAPNLLKIRTVSSTELELTFNEELYPATAANISNFLLDNSINPINAFVSGEKQNIVQITFQDDFSETQHELRISNIEDLCTNAIDVFDTVFSYYPGKEFDVLINELMIDVSPEPNVLPPAKFIEIYNQTDVAIDLSDWALVIDENIKYFSGIKLDAKSYLILCDKDDTTLFANYGKVYGIFSSSNLSSDKGQISLLNSNNLLIDYLNYSSAWITDEDKKPGGWSLERIDPLNYCAASANWSVSSDYKGGTPGKLNSVYTDNEDKSTFEIVGVKLLSSAKIAVSFSKNLKEEQALNTANYTVDNGLGEPIFANFSDTSRSTLILQFATQFTDAYTHTLSIKNIVDFCENPLINPEKEFIYHLIYPQAAYAESENILKVIFSEEIEIVTAQQTENYTVSPDLDNPEKAYKHSTKSNQVFLEFALPFENAKKYNLAIEKVKDLNGNAIKPAGLDFVWFEPSGNDIVLNEILFNPKSGGVDFVEIYNNSAYPVDLSHLQIAKRNDEGIIDDIKGLSDENDMLLPGTYLCITTDSSLTKTTYPATSYGRFVQLKSLPSFPDDEGTVVLFFQDKIIDEFSYNKDMHLSLISDANGVSLERLNPDAETSDPQNWFSAAESVGFATPANQNSQFTEFSSTDFNEILIEPEVFSPNNDGYDDRVFIRYKFAEAGFVANVSIYSSKGQLVKRIANNELLATEGRFSWDGLYEDNQRATIGIYIVYFEVFNLQGEVKKYKKTCVLAAKLR